ncbi:hypothetical protein COEREDRAFT_7985 [Coemansia reversa NRRL 1564]|uniref:Protein kinase domain-containing protein n=1 Tax=Coemansia reversa (strain ATCC 12441 / NRRL 1564) TaxID=763665 RepID=A0A2G5BCU7_COERN|nr:hypothetical protein COEREDRAFT_7985 [Coemansia reversa NRRL 1564]|eukprot:PIA16835.1 hypothetical protein COEREDRAFT_7985 [Coemansia reversa NRRL 1564]
MRCHSSILNRCGVLHRDISTNNILVVRESQDALPRGLLIDFDFAVPVDREKRAARPAQSGTLPYMSIANLENIDTARTALDDWESLLYVVCWLATFGISSSYRNADAELENSPICQWRVGEENSIAETKRGHMDTERTFASHIVKHFQSEYKLLRRLATKLHKALFSHVGCGGAIDISSLKKILSLSDSEDSDHFDTPGVDPLIARNDYVSDILIKLQDVMGKHEKHARTQLLE